MSIPEVLLHVVPVFHPYVHFRGRHRIHEVTGILTSMDDPKEKDASSMGLTLAAIDGNLSLLPCVSLEDIQHSDDDRFFVTLANKDTVMNR